MSELFTCLYVSILDSHYLLSKIKSSFFSLLTAYVSVSTNTCQLTLLSVISVELTDDQPFILQQRRDLEVWKPQVKWILSYFFYTCLSSFFRKFLTCFITSNKVWNMRKILGHLIDKINRLIGYKMLIYLFYTLVLKIQPCLHSNIY